MGGFFSRLFGKRPRESALPTSYGLKDDALYSDNGDVLDGLEFFATMQLRTPLSVLQHHGEVFKGPPSRAPRYASDADGIWVPRTKSWASLGFNLREPPESSAASDIGVVKPSEYLPFLVAFRRIVESSDSHATQLEALLALSTRSAAFRSFFERHQSHDPQFPVSFFHRRLMELPGVGPATAKALYEAGFRTVDEVRSASREALLGVRGVGPRLAQRLMSST